MTSKSTGEQKQAISSGINGGELAAVFDMHPHTTKLELWARKTGRAEKPSEDQRRRMIVGLYRNPAIAEAYADIRKRCVSHVGRFCQTHRHENKPLAVATPTGLVHRAGKSSSVEAVLRAERINPWAMQDWGKEGSDTVPEHTLMRATWEAGVVGVDRTDVVIETNGLTVYSIDFDEDYFDSLYDEVAKFWRDHVVTDKAPPAALQDEQVLRMLHRRNTKDMIGPTAELSDMVAAYSSASTAIKSHELAKKAAKIRLLELLGDHSGCVGDGWKISYKNNKGREHTDWPNIARKLGATSDLIAEFTDIKPGPRVLRVTDKRDK